MIGYLKYSLLQIMVNIKYVRLYNYNFRDLNIIK